MVVEERKEERMRKEFLNRGLFIQPHSAFGRSIDIHRIPVHTLAGWSNRTAPSSRLLVLQRAGERHKAPSDMARVDTFTDGSKSQ